MWTSNVRPGKSWILNFSCNRSPEAVCVRACVCVCAHTCARVCVCVGKGEFLKATGGREEMQRKTVVCVGEVLTCFFGSCVFSRKKKKKFGILSNDGQTNMSESYMSEPSSLSYWYYFYFSNSIKQGEKKMPPACQEECVSMCPICTQIKPHSDWHVGGRGCLGDGKNTKCLSFTRKWKRCKRRMSSFLSSLLHTVPSLSFLRRNLLSSASHSIFPITTLTLYLSATSPSLLTCPHISIILGLRPLLHAKPSTHLFPPSLSMFHRFNRMHLGHTSILCNLYHQGAKLGSYYRPGK